MDIVGLENTAQIGLVRCPDTQALDGRGLVPEGFKEGIRKTRGVKRLLREVGNGLFYFYRVQFAPLLDLYLIATSQEAQSDQPTRAALAGSIENKGNDPRRAVFIM